MKKQAEQGSQDLKKEKLKLQRIIGRNIRKYRLKHDYSQDYLADKLQVTTAHINQVENGYKALSLVRLRSAAEVLSVSISALFADEEKGSDHLENITAILSGLETDQLEKTEKIFFCIYDTFLR